MPDTRKEYNKGIPGFIAGQGRMNQILGSKKLKIGLYDWDIHATVETFDSTGSGATLKKKVKTFHVSLYSDQKRWGGFYWTFSGSTFGGGKYKGEPKTKFGDAAAISKLLRTASGVAQALKGKFGANIATASW